MALERVFWFFNVLHERIAKSTFFFNDILPQAYIHVSRTFSIVSIEKEGANRSLRLDMVSSDVFLPVCFSRT